MNKKFSIVLTSDYEVWGDGSGCVEKCVIDPMIRFLDIADEYNAKVTIFFDVCEYWAFSEIESSNGFSGNYRPATLMKEQLQDAFRRGHDVQLHFHPQWLNYSFISNQEWILDMRYWALPEVDNYHDESWDLKKLFAKGIDTLEKLFKTIDPQYEVKVFRAGGWCIQPEKKIFEQLRNFNISIDSTIASGVKRDLKRGSFDFSSYPDLPYWQLDDKTNQCNNKLKEIPISTAFVNSIEMAIFKLLKLKNINSLKAPNCYSKPMKENRLNTKFSSLVKADYCMLNLSDGVSFYEMKKMTKKVAFKWNSSLAKKMPIVTISHPKTFGNSTSFRKYLHWLSKQTEFEFGSYKEWI